jgi:hypothetical protein
MELNHEFKSESEQRQPFRQRGKVQQVEQDMMQYWGELH